MDKAEHMKHIYRVTTIFYRLMTDRLMEEKNLEKLHWLKCTKHWLEDCLETKSNEYFNMYDSKEKQARLVDIANFAMMLHDWIKHNG